MEEHKDQMTITAIKEDWFWLLSHWKTVEPIDEEHITSTAHSDGDCYVV